MNQTPKNRTLFYQTRNAIFLVLPILFTSTIQADTKATDCPVSNSNNTVLDTSVFQLENVFESASLKTAYRSKTINRDNNCYLDSMEVDRLVDQKQAVLVDIRDPKEFANYRISGSLNINPQHMKTKSFLRDKQVILVNEGHSYASLEGLCHDLREKGFKQVAVLDGGLNAWRREVGPLAGEIHGQKILNRISPSQFYRERKYSHWKLVDLEELEANQQTRTKESFEISNSSGTVESWKVTLVQAATTEEDPPPYLLVVTADGSGFDSFLTALQGTDLLHVYFLEGGRRGYERFLRSQQQMLTYRHRIPSRQGCGGVN